MDMSTPRAILLSRVLCVFLVTVGITYNTACTQVDPDGTGVSRLGVLCEQEITAGKSTIGDEKDV